MLLNTKKAATFVLLLLLSFVVVSLPEVNIVDANFMPIPTPQPAFVIREDGRVDPPTAPIQRIGEVYTLTDDIAGYTIAVERDNIVIDGGGYTLLGNGNSTGVFIKNRNSVIVRNLEISNFYYGIRLFAEPYMGMSSEGNILSGNTLTNNKYGIYVGSSSFNTLSNNHINSNKHGLYISSSNNVLRNNHMNNNSYNFFVYATTLSDSINDIDDTNTINGKPIIYWINQQNKPVPSEVGYIALVNCTGMTVRNFELANNGQGILLVSVTNSTISQNRIINNKNGIWIAASSNNRISENTITRSGHDAIYVYYSANNNIIANTITNNGYDGMSAGQVIGSNGRGAIRLTGSSNNSISENIIEYNGEGINLQGSSDSYIAANNIKNNNGTAIHLFGSTDVNITGNRITENSGWGITIWSSSNNTVHSNYISNNNDGILIDDSAQNKIVHNTSTGNSGWGIQIKSAGLGPSSSADNIIHHNNFINNKAEGLQVSIPGIWAYPEGWIPGVGNVWDDGEEGNYWGDFTSRYPNSTEIEDASVWDTAYYINPNNIDHHPLMAPVDINSIPEFPACIFLPLFMVATLITVILYKRLPKKA
jgi:parallel beta-helix repeat protein